MRSENRQYYQFVRTEIPVSIVSADVPDAERRIHPFAVVFRVPYEPGRGGLVAKKSDVKRIQTIETNLVNRLEPDGHIHVGSTLRGGQMTIFFYCRRALGEPITVKSGWFSKETLVAECREDPNWQVFEQHLVITKPERFVERNAPLMAQLKHQGDDFSKSRPVDFFAVFPSEAQREQFARDVEAQGFTLNPGISDDAKGLYGLECVKETSIRPDVIAAICADVDDLAARHGGVLDGWQTPTVR
jgi:hypothetical protein